MADKQKRKPPAPPDGEPAERRDDLDSTTRSRVLEAQDPAISGDADKDVSRNSGEPAVDSAGQIVRRKKPVDDLH